MLDSVLCSLVRVVGWILCRLPPSVCVAIGQALGEVAYWLSPKRARIGVLNLKAAFGPRLAPGQPRRIVRRIFRNLGAGIVEMLRLPAIDAAYVDRYIELSGREHLEGALASGRPIMFLTGHFGNWELCSITAAFKGHPIIALARAQANLPKLYALLVSYRESKGCRIVHKGGAMKQLFRELEQRKLIGIVGDQVSRQGNFVEFFGRPALFATGPFELARSTGALILPAFIHRVRGPFHRLVLEPVIDLSQERGTKEAIVQTGIERFAGMLQRLVEADPVQWLWLHKRWKHTPARRVAILSDGKLGHVKQSQMVIEAMRAQQPAVQAQQIEVRYRHPLGRGLAVVWATLVPGRVGRWICLRAALTRDSYRALACAAADIVVSCGSSTAPVNLLVGADWRAKSVVVMNPAPLPLSAFDLALVPAHDRLRARPNVVQTYGALGFVDEATMAREREHLRAHPRFRPAAVAPAPGQAPAIAVLLGGDSDAYQMTTDFAAALIDQVLAVCDQRQAVCLVTTSRRTPPEVERMLEQRLRAHPRCALLLLASRDQLNGTVTGMLGWATVAVVTGESISMVSEACASGRRVVVIELPRRPGARGEATKSRSFITTLVAEGYVRAEPVDRFGAALRESLDATAPPRRLDTFALVRDAVKRLM